MLSIKIGIGVLPWRNIDAPTWPNKDSIKCCMENLTIFKFEPTTPIAQTTLNKKKRERRKKREKGMYN